MEKIQISTQDDDNADPEYGFRSGNLFIMEGSSQMHEPQGDLGSYFLQSLLMYQNILKEKLYRNRDDWMGLIVFAVTKSDPDTKDILTVLEFGPVDIDMLKRLDEIIETEMPFYEAIASDATYPLPEVLLKSLHTFDPIKIQMDVRQVNLITCHDNPLSNDNDQRNMARIHAKSFHSIPITLKVVGFGNSWDFDLFFKELEMLSTNSTIEPKRTYAPDLEGQVMKKRQSIVSLTLRIADEVQINVNLQSAVKKALPLTTVAMNKETNEPLDQFFHYKKLEDCFDEEPDYQDNADVDDIEDYPVAAIRKHQRVGGRDILISLEEAATLVHLKPKGIEILQFQEAGKNPPWEHLQPAFILSIPADAPVNEKRFFTGLLFKFREKNAEAICAATAREDSKTFLYRMWPCKDYSAFYFYRIPWEEEVSRPTEVLFPQYKINRGGRTFEPDEEKMKLMENVVKRFRIRYFPRIFPNPKLAKQMQYLLTLALDAKDNEQRPFDDYTEPDRDILETMLKRKDLLDKFFDAFPSTLEGQELPATKVVRLDDVTAMRMALSDDLRKFTVAQLRSILKALQLGSTGAKAALIDRIEEWKDSLE